MDQKEIKSESIEDQDQTTNVEDNKTVDVTNRPSLSPEPLGQGEFDDICDTKNFINESEF